MNILIAGAGMYVTGRFHSGHGTILSSIFESSKSINIDLVTIIARGEENKTEVENTTKRINERLNTNVKVEFIKISGDPDNLPEEVLNVRSFDCAIVCTPDHLHYSFTKVLLNKNIHCLVVKPFTPTHDEAVELTRIQKENGLYGAVEFHKRYDETNLFVKKIIGEGQLGDLLYITVDYSQRVSIPTQVFRSWAHHSNIFQYLAVHYVDLIHFMTGYIPIKAQGIGIYGTGVRVMETTRLARIEMM
jgi:predicted dehydrogenase